MKDNGSFEALVVASILALGVAIGAEMMTGALGAEVQHTANDCHWVLEAARHESSLLNPAFSETEIGLHGITQ